MAPRTLLAPVFAMFLALPLAAPAANAVRDAADAQLVASATGPAPVEGVDYVVIPDGAPFEAANGQVEVVEVFGYTCGHCANFQPLVNAWKARLPADVRLTYVPAPFGGYWIPYAKAYYAAEALGIAGQTHDAMFRALHVEHALPIQNATPQEIGRWYAAHSGADADAFAAAMEGFDMAAKLRRATAFIQRAAVPGAPRLGTPMLIVAGKYRVLGRTPQDLLRIASHLVLAERAARDE